MVLERKKRMEKRLCGRKPANARKMCNAQRNNCRNWAVLGTDQHRHLKMRPVTGHGAMHEHEGRKGCWWFQLHVSIMLLVFQFRLQGCCEGQKKKFQLLWRWGTEDSRTTEIETFKSVSGSGMTDPRVIWQGHSDLSLGNINCYFCGSFW